MGRPRRRSPVRHPVLERRLVRRLPVPKITAHPAAPNPGHRPPMVRRRGAADRTGANAIPSAAPRSSR